MILPLCLLTCDRYDKTQITLETLAQHNHMPRFELLHADDASTDRRIAPLVKAHGFETVAVSRRRQGQQTMRRELIREAVYRGHKWILLWENDLESVRGFPWPLFEFVRNYPCSWDTAIWGLRLFGAKREREGDGWPCSTVNAATGRDMDWKPLEGAPEAAEVGSAHWSTRAFVARAGLLQELSEYSTAEAAMKVPLRGLRVARCVENVVWHMGHGAGETTPGNLRC